MFPVRNAMVRIGFQFNCVLLCVRVCVYVCVCLKQHLFVGRGKNETFLI